MVGVRTFDDEQSGSYDARNDAGGDTLVNTVIFLFKLDHGQVARTRKYSGRRRKRTYCLYNVNAHRYYR